MSHEAVIAQLNECLKHEWTGVAQYSQASFIVEGVWREVYAKTFMENAEESFGHAKAVEMYTKALELAEGNRPLVIFLENILEEEQEGVDEFTKLLRNSETNVAASVDSKTA